MLKNHFAETAGLAYLARKYGAQGIEVFGAVTLDTPTGGVNPQAVRYMVDVTGGWGRIVWMPTHDSEHEVTYNKEQRPLVRVSRDGVLLPEVLEVLDLIAEHGLTLATGHVTPEETLMILAEARKRGITRLIVTHPLLDPQFTFMSVPQLREAAAAGRDHRDHGRARFVVKGRDARACSKPFARSGPRAFSSAAIAGSSARRTTPTRS